MKKKLSIFIVFLLCFGSLMSVGANQFGGGERDHYLVGFKGEVNRGLIKAFGVKDEEILHQYEAIPTVLMSLTKNQVKALEKHPQIDYIEADAEVDMLFEEITIGQTVPWGVTIIQAETAHGFGFTGQGVKVGVIDTGIHAAHPDLTVQGGHSVFTDPSNNNPYVDYIGTGTHVAGIIAARNNDIGVVGVAPNAELYSIKIFNNQGSGSLGGIVQGIEWGIMNGMDVLNVNVTLPYHSQSIEYMVNLANDLGIVVVAPVGDFGGGARDSVAYPARYSSVIGVGAINSQRQMCSFSSLGPAVEFVGPGCSIYSTYPTNTYTNRNGTAMAAAHISGAAALIKGARFSLTNHQIRQSLNETLLLIGPINPPLSQRLPRVMNAIQYAMTHF